MRDPRIQGSPGLRDLSGDSGARSPASGVSNHYQWGDTAVTTEANVSGTEPAMPDTHTYDWPRPSPDNQLTDCHALPTGSPDGWS